MRGAQLARRRHSRDASDAGMVTAEAALGICAVVGVFAVVLAGAGAMINQLRCTDAAVEAARLLARGDAGRAGSAVASIAGPRAELDVLPAADRVTAEVRVPLTGFAGLVQARARAVAVLEPGVRPDSPGSAGRPGGAGQPDAGEPGGAGG